MQIMLRQSEIKQKLKRIEREIDEVAKSCDADTNLPQNLRDCITEWKQEAVKSPAIIESKDNQRIVDCINDLEKIGHRAEMALQDITEIDTKMRDTLQHAQSELLILKKK